MRIAEAAARGTVSRLGVWVRGDCACGDAGALLYDTDETGPLVCAQCYRKWTKAQPPVRQTCDACGSDGNVWRDPIHRRNEYLCINCHDPESLFQNRWANKVRESKPLRDAGVRCGAAGYGTDCSGELKWRGPQGMVLCNKHAGKKGSETWIGQSGLLS